MDLKIVIFILVTFFVALTWVGFLLFIKFLADWKKDKSNNKIKRKMQICLIFFLLMLAANIISALYGMYFFSKN